MIAEMLFIQARLGASIIKHCGFPWSLYLGKIYPNHGRHLPDSHVTLQSLYAVRHPVNPSPALCVPGLRRGRTVTAHWLSQGRTKREAGTSTQVRYLINLSLILVSLTLTLPHRKQVNTMTASGLWLKCFILDWYISLLTRVKVLKALVTPRSCSAYYI